MNPSVFKALLDLAICARDRNAKDNLGCHLPPPVISATLFDPIMLVPLSMMSFFAERRSLVM